ncbi:integrase [uncultured Maritimibacter sp.]|uniref:integrase n=1 Tax=uncultured Maritimibacter sp. TaxID=991866 RepID=UPI0026207A35|nr:integrase [uncultured Maritimibacter sp.]
MKTDSRAISDEKARAIWELQLTIWEARRAGRDDDAAALHRRLVEISERRGFPYASAAQIAAAPLPEILARIATAHGDAPEVADALLGTREAPPVTLSALFDAYKEIVAVDIRGKSEGQRRKWENDRQHATTYARQVLGDVPALTMTRSDAMKLRNALAARIEVGKLVPYSANRTMITLGAMIKTTARAHGIADPEPFAGLLFKDPKKRRRHADLRSYPSDWIAAHVLAPGALSSLNDDARAILQLVATIGARPSEICNLTAATIHLDAPVPFVSIEPDGRETKTAAAVRRVPLTGHALDILTAHPAGFPRYRDKAAGWSAAVNKQLREKTPRPSPDHTAYDLRHAFRDRLRAVGCPDTMADFLMGHEEQGTAYGEGATLETLRHWLERIEVRFSDAETTA